jgi:Transglutaminase-like superfamily
MRRISKFLNLSSTEQRLLIRTWILLGSIRLGMALLPFSTLRKLLYRFRSILGRGEKEFSEDRLVWSVGVVSHYIPKATCLAQAITTQILLQQAGHQACLHIGVTEADKGGLKAHAWVESQGKVLIGGIDLNQYTHLLALE